ncbi:MAG: TonB-dependent receptor, partial [Ferruginibacter sp.]|nr:TonB-dependent receptor [Ferruginibacter sp.]
IIKNKLYFGASGVFNKRDGYYTNTFNNSSFDKQKGISGNYFLKYLPGNNWGITLNAKHQNNRNDGAFPMVFGVDDAFSNPYKVNQNATAKMIDNTFDASLSFNHTGAVVNFLSQSTFQQNYRYYNAPLDGDFSPADAVTVINNYGGDWNKVKVFTQEFKFSSPANKSSTINWTAGTYFFHQSNPSKQATHFGKDAGLLGVPDSNFSTINTTKGANTGIAFYGQATYSLTKKLTLIAGLRYDYEHKKLAVKGAYQKDGQDAFVTTPDTAGSVHYTALSPKLGLGYALKSTSYLFATYSRGYRTGGLTQLSSDPSQPPLYPYNPEYSNNIEAGIKNTFLNGKLSLNVTAFYTFVNNAQVPTLILPDAITVTKNTGQLKSSGAELELLAKPVKGIDISYNFGYTHAKYSSLKIASNGQAEDLQGKRQIFTPDATSMLAVQYSQPINADKQLQLIARAEWVYLGTQYFDLANTIRQSPYSLLHTRLGVSCKHTELFFWARNITSKKYIEYAYDFGAVHLGNPGTYGITARFMF